MKSLYVQIEDDLYLRLKDYARKKNLPLKKIVAEIFENYFDSDTYNGVKNLLDDRLKKVLKNMHIDHHMTRLFLSEILIGQGKSKEELAKSYKEIIEKTDLKFEE
jgi:NCAIR mutase (PurE)-related protein